MKIKKQFKNFHWDNFIYNLKLPSLLSESLITRSINEFWKINVDHLNTKQYVILLFRAETDLGIYFTLGRLVRLNKSDKDYYINLIKDTLDLKSNDYNHLAISRVIISFGYREGLIPAQRIITQTKSFQNYRHYKLPLTMDPLKYSSNKPQLVLKNCYVMGITPLTTAIIFVSDNENQVEILKSSVSVLKYTDRKIDDNKFERNIGSNHYIYVKEGDTYKLDLFSVKKPVRRIKSIPLDKKINDKFITMDIETFVLPNGNMVPYLISWFDGINTKSYISSKYKNFEDMIITAMIDLMKVKYNGYTIYLHNFAKFDSIFILKILNKIGNIRPLIHNDRIISLPFTFTKIKSSRSYSFTFNDSMLLLTSSLKRLGINYAVETKKGVFPHRFVTENNLNYVGEVPSFEYFDDITKSEYDNYCSNFNNNWSLIDEAIKYCEDDCITLYQIMHKFNEIIFDKYNINAIKVPTISSLGIKIFRSNYIDQAKVFIPMISGKIANDIRLSYTGGATDMYIPTNIENELVYGYDVNSLYPNSMANSVLPVGKPTYFEGDIRKHDPDAYGFFYCNITTPEYLEHPILQTHVKTKNGLRTVAALGNYEDMIYSEVMDTCSKIGYKFEILRGYTFKKAYFLSSYIKDLYNTRLKYPKTHPMNYTAKLLMNSLYGRFGMDDRISTTHIIAKKDYLKFEQQNFDYIKSINPLGDCIMAEVVLDDTRQMLDNGSFTHIVNVGVSRAISGDSRNYMSQFKNNPKLKLFYSDTDSIYTNLNPDQMNELYPGIVSSTGLGKLKLETVSTKAIFIAPKLYYLKTIEGKEIYKVKGLDKNVPLTEQDFQELLYKNNTIIKNQEKWYRILDESTIKVRNEIYTIQQTDNKRSLIYNSNNKLEGTKPYVISKDKIII